MWALSSGGSLIISPNESSDIVELKLIDQNTDGSFMISVEGASEHLLGYTDTYLNLNKFSRLEHAVKREPQDSDYLANGGHLDVPLVGFGYWQNPEGYRREDGTPAEGVSYTLHSEGNALSRNLHYESSSNSLPYFRSYSGGFESGDNYLRLEYCLNEIDTQHLVRMEIPAMAMIDVTCESLRSSMQQILMVTKVLTAFTSG